MPLEATILDYPMELDRQLSVRPNDLIEKWNLSGKSVQRPFVKHFQNKTPESEDVDVVTRIKKMSKLNLTVLYIINFKSNR